MRIILPGAQPSRLDQAKPHTQHWPMAALLRESHGVGRTQPAWQPPQSIPSRPHAAGLGRQTGQGAASRRLRWGSVGREARKGDAEQAEPKRGQGGNGRTTQRDRRGPRPEGSAGAKPHPQAAADLHAPPETARHWGGRVHRLRFKGETGLPRAFAPRLWHPPPTRLQRGPAALPPGPGPSSSAPTEGLFLSPAFVFYLVLLFSPLWSFVPACPLFRRLWFLFPLMLCHSLHLGAFLSPGF